MNARDQRPESGSMDPNIVAVIGAVVACLDKNWHPVAIREAQPVSSLWKWVGRREGMQGGWPR